MAGLPPSLVTADMLCRMSPADRARYSPTAAAVTSSTGRPRRQPPEVAALALVTADAPPVAIGPQGWRARLEVRPAAGTPFPLESKLQAALLRWINERADRDGGRWLAATMIFSVPNQARRARGLAGRMLAEGMKAGVPDLLLLVPRRGFHGLALELKNDPKAKPTEEQSAWLDWLESHSYFAAVGRTLEEAQNILEGYL